MRALLRSLGEILSFLIDSFLLIVSLWFLIGLIGFGLFIVIAFLYGLLNLR